MKFKKTHFLLMAIAIVLLIGIGSVCASENVTDDSGDTLADDGTDVVLSNTDENVLDDTSEEKTNTTVETENDTYEYKEDANKTISVDVKDNANNKINVNKSDLSVFNGSKAISFEYNSSIITITEQLPCGYYNLTINYLGNANYCNSSKIVSVKIFGNTTIETETSVVCDGKNVEIPVKISDQAGYIEELNKTNFNLTLIYTNETGNVSNLTISDFNVEDGKIKFTSPVDKLINASVIIEYANATEPKTVAIKVSTEINATVVKDQYESEEIKNISIGIKDGQGNLINISKNDLEVFENGTAVEFTYNNTNITITSISEGSHNLTIVYKGNETYSTSNTTVVLNVYGKNQIIVPEYVVSNNGKTVEIHMIIFNGLNNLTIDPNNLTLNLTYTDATGNVASAIIETEAFEFAGEELIIQDIGHPLNKASLTINYTDSAGAKTVKINLLTTVNATPAKPKYRYNETNNITVKVLDFDGNPLNISKDDLKVFDNGNEIAFTFNNSNITVNLEEGVHNLTITYKGNETYNSSSTTIEVKVNGDARINPDESVVLDDANTATIFVNLNDGADLIPIDQSKLNVTLFYTVGNQTFNRTVSDFTLIENKTITFKVNEDFDSAYVNIKYDNKLTGNTTVKVNTTITAPDTLTYGQSEVKNLTIEVKGTNGHVINITDANIQILKDGKALNITVNGSVVTINDALTYGIYNLTIKYLGTPTYIESNKTVVLTVYGINATSSINVNSTKIGTLDLNVISGNETVNITADDLTLNVTYKNGNDTVVIPVTAKRLENGSLIFTLKDGNFTTAILNIRYRNTEVNVTLNRKYNVKIEAINNVVEYQSGKLIYKIIDIDTNEPLANKTIELEYKITTGAISISGVSGSGITIVSTITNTTNENGELVFDNHQMDGKGWGYMDAGNYTVTLKFGQFNKTNGTSQNIVVNKATINIIIDDYKEYYGSDKKLKITVVNANTGDPVKNTILHLYLPVTTQKDYYFQTNENGTNEINVNGFVGGTYELTVSNNDTININNKSVSGSFTILKIPAVINTKDVTVYYNTGTTTTIKVTKDGKPLSGMYVFVRIYKTSKKYDNYVFQTNSKGEISFSASLTVGKHKIIVASADNRYDASQVTKTITVKKASGKFTAKKVTTYYKAGKYFTVKLTNTKKKKPIYDAKVNIKIFISKTRYYNYNGKTGMNGQLKLLLDQLKPGTYKIVVSCADSKDYSAKEVTTKIVIKKAPAKLIAKKLTAKKGDKKYFKVKVKNKKTKKVITGVKVKIKVYTGKKVKTYTAKTDAKGIAKISTQKLKVGKHKVVVTSANKYVTAKKTKSTIKIKK